jgi:hypothetical protein
MRHCRIDQHLESDELAAVQAEVHGIHFDHRCIIGQEPVVSVSKTKRLAQRALIGPAALALLSFARFCL